MNTNRIQRAKRGTGVRAFLDKLIWVEGENSAIMLNTRTLPIIITLLFTLILAGNLYTSPSFRFIYASEEFLNLLFTQPGFLQHLFDEERHFAYPWQNLNPLAWIGLKLAAYLPIPPLLLLWMLQTVLVYLLLRRMFYVLQRWAHPVESLPLFLILAVHPLFWIVSLTSPTQLLTAWFFFVALDAYPDAAFQIYKWFIALFLLSLCGPLGLILSATLALGQIIHLVYKFYLFPRRPLQALPLILISISAVVPAMGTFLALSWESGIWGGAWLANAATLFSEPSLDKLFNGQWTATSRSWLYQLAAGFVQIPKFIPLFGLLLLFGILATLRERYATHPLSRILFFTLLVLFLFTSFQPAFAQQNASLIMFLISLIFAVHGLHWLQEKNPSQNAWIISVLTLGLCLLFLLTLPQAWAQLMKRADYERVIHQTILQNWIEPQKIDGPAIAITFIPSIHAQIPRQSVFFPLGLRLNRRIALGSELSAGIHLELCDMLEPRQIILFPTFDEAARHGPGYLSENRWMSSINEFYEREIIQNSVFYTLKADTRLDILNKMIRRALDEGGAMNYMQSNAWARGWSHPREELPLFISKNAGEAYQREVGVQWRFEWDMPLTLTLGFAFSRQLDRSQTAIGSGSVGPGSIKALWPMGQIESEPFVIQGQEMLLAAKLPRNSTESVICLAVYQEEAFGPFMPVSQALHIIEHSENKPLMGETFYYIRPSQLRYEGGKVRGWRVVRELRARADEEWQVVTWSLDPWMNQPAIWFAADRDHAGAVWIDQILQRKRPPGYTWNFEDGTYTGWTVEGEAFGSKPAIGPYGNQQPVHGFEGNYFINTYHEGSDLATGIMTSPPIPITLDRMSFLVGGGSDSSLLYVGLVVDGEIVLRASGNQSETLHVVTWDLTPWRGQEAHIQMADLSGETWGHILVDDIRIYNEPPVYRP